MTSLELTGSQADSEKWQRLAPAAMIHFAVQFVLQFVKQGIQGLLPLGAVFLTAGENRWFVIGLIAAGVVVLLLAGAVLSYLKFRFRLSGDTFLIQKGVFRRKRLSLTYDRIQNVAFKQPIYFRPFHLVVLGIESAGSSGEEVSLGGIPRKLAEEIRASIFEKRTSSPANNDAEKANEDIDAVGTASADSEEIIHQPISELVRYGLSNNNIWVFAGLAAAAMAQLDWEDYIIVVDAREIAAEISNYGIATAIFFALLSFVALITALLSVSALGSIITYYDYHLTRTDGRFHRTKGLFERQETSLPERKVQSLIIKQPWPARLLKRFHLHLRQVGFDNWDGQNPGAGQSKFLVPSVTNCFATDFSKILYPNFNWTELELKPIDPIFVRKMVLWVMLPIAMLPAISISFVAGPMALAILAIPFLLSPGVMLRRARYGYATDGVHGIVRSGFVGHKLTIFPFYKVQTVQLWQSPGQRQRGLATLSIKLAGFELDIPYMPLADAQAWRDQILHEIETHRGSWM